MTFKTPIRGKAKIKSDLSIRDYYRYYKTRTKSKGRKPVDYTLYRDIIKDFNKELVNEITYNNEVVKLPYKLGYLGIMKFKTNLNPDKQYTWKVDYKKSKEMGFIVYFDQEFRYKWKWDKKNIALKGKRWYKFLPCRQASRSIAKALKSNKKLDYYEKIR